MNQNKNRIKKNEAQISHHSFPGQSASNATTIISNRPIVVTTVSNSMQNPTEYPNPNYR